MQPRLPVDSCGAAKISSSPVVVAQHLDAEQRNYQFPPHSVLVKLSAILNSNAHEMFDESSFATTTVTASSVDHRDDDDDAGTDEEQLDSYIGSIVSSYQQQRNAQSTHSMTSSRLSAQYGTPSQQQLVEDHWLSPLALPARIDPRTNRTRQVSSNSASSTRTQRAVAAPCSFLSMQSARNRIVHSRGTMWHRESSCYASHDESNLSVFRNESEPILDDDDDDGYTFNAAHSTDDSDSKVVVLRLPRERRLSSGHASDEGYNDEVDDDEEGPMLDSVSVFLPLSADELDREHLRDMAATRIQSVWRGYRARKQLFGGKCLKPAQRVVIDLARICMTLHRKHTARIGERITLLEEQVRNESAMRIAFENAIEDMTIMIDKQQATLYDRMDEMRASYEHRLRQERRARERLEQSMNGVLQRVQHMQHVHEKRAKEEASANAALQHKLDRALAEIEVLKRRQQPSTTAPRKPAPQQPLSSKMPDERHTTISRRSQHNIILRSSTKSRLNTHTTTTRSITPINTFTDTTTSASITTPNTRRRTTVLHPLSRSQYTPRTVGVRR